jgi:hypothetical protein
MTHIHCDAAPQGMGASIRRLRRGSCRLAVAAAIALAGCASQEPSQTGFLADYSQLQPTAAHPDDPGFRKPGSLASYTAFIVDKVVYRPAAGAPALDPAAEAELTGAYHDRLVAAFAEKYHQAAEPAAGVMRVRAAVTNVAEAIPLLNLVTMAAAVVPVTAGGASTEAEVTDSLTGERLAAYQGFNNGGRSFLGGPIGFLTIHGQARRAFTIQAEELRDLLADEPTTVGASPAAGEGHCP